MNKTPLFFLEHIIRASSEIETYTKNISLEKFLNDSMRYNATIRMVSVIGEAIAKLEKEFKTAHPQIPWREIQSMRNRLIHEYWQTDLEQAYVSAQKDVPLLRSMAEDILRGIKDE